jgi:hypothetical protein
MPQGRMYTASFKGVAVTAVQDLFEVLAATGKPVCIHGFSIAQSSDVGDAGEEILRLTTNRGVGSVTSGSGGTTATVVPLDVNDTAFGGTVECNNTTAMAVGSGTLTELEAHCMNVRVPYVFWYTPETRPIIAPGNRWTLELDTTAPADSLTMSGTIWLEEG